MGQVEDFKAGKLSPDPEGPGRDEPRRATASGSREEGLAALRGEVDGLRQKLDRVLGMIANPGWTSHLRQRRGT